MSAPSLPALVREAFAALPEPAALRLADGTVVAVGAPGPAAFTVAVRSDACLARILADPTPLRFGEELIAGGLDVEGDLFAAMRAAHRLEDLALARPHARPAPATAPDAAAAVAFHYDVSNAFYALFLDRRMVYSCAYYPAADADLETAQAAKLDRVCRKLRLAPRERFLDLGCGWGALVAWAAERYGATAEGITLSRVQADFATTALRTAGLDARARVVHGDYRDLPAATHADKLAAVGLMEHAGRAGLATLFRRAHDLLPPGGLFLNHGITIRRGAPPTSEMQFLTRHVFPGGELSDLGAVLAAMEEAGFRILDVESLRPHYARTTRDWVARLQARAGAARALVGTRTYRTWLVYLAAASVAFEEGAIGVIQILAARTRTA